MKLLIDTAEDNSSPVSPSILSPSVSFINMAISRAESSLYFPIAGITTRGNIERIKSETSLQYFASKHTEDIDDDDRYQELGEDSDSENDNEKLAFNNFSLITPADKSPFEAIFEAFGR